MRHCGNMSIRLNPLYHHGEVQPCQCSLADDVGKSHSGHFSRLVQWSTPFSWPSVVIHFHLRSCKKCAWPTEGLRGPRRTFQVGLNRIEVAARPPERLGCSHLGDHLTDRHVLIAQRLVYDWSHLLVQCVYSDNQPTECSFKGPK
jgi:hypothetical protein